MTIVPENEITFFCSEVINSLYKWKSSDQDTFNLYIHFLASLYCEFSCLIGNNIIVSQIHSISNLPKEQVHKTLLFNLYQFHSTFKEYHEVIQNLITKNVIIYDDIVHLSEYKKNLMYCFSINRLLFPIRRYLNNNENVVIKNKLYCIFDNEFAKRQIDVRLSFTNELNYYSMYVDNIDDHETYIFLFNSLQKLINEYPISLI